MTIIKDRPDFRVFIDFLFGANRNVDTDGDSSPVNSRTWSYLYMADRESDVPFVEITGDDLNPDIFKVESASIELEELAALYLFMYCGLTIEADDEPLAELKIESLKQKYTVQLQRAEASVWHRSSNENPYPNLA